MPNYDIEFNIGKEEHINNIEINFYNNQDEIFETRLYPPDIINIKKFTSEIKYEANKHYSIDKDIFYDDYYKLDAYIDGTKLTEEQFSYDNETKLITFSYKMDLEPNTIINIEYYKKCVSIQCEFKEEVKNIIVRPNYTSSVKLGQHTNLI